MPHVKTRGFVVRVVPVGESDRIISLLTEELGLISVSVQGARRTRSPHLLTTQIFSFGQYELFQNRGHYALNASELIEPFMALQKDIDRLVCAAHLAEVLVDCLRDDIAQPALYRFWAYSLQALQEQADPLLTVHTAQWRLLTEIGLAPRLDGCVICGDRSGNDSFSIKACGVVCGKSSCLGQAADTRPVSAGCLACMRHIQDVPIGKLFHFQLDDAVRQAFIAFSDAYLSFQMEKEYTRLQMLQTLSCPDNHTGQPDAGLPSPQKTCKTELTSDS